MHYADAQNVSRSAAALARGHEDGLILMPSSGRWKKVPLCAMIATASIALPAPSSKATCISRRRCGSSMMVLQSCAAENVQRARGRKASGRAAIINVVPRSHMKSSARQFKSPEDMRQRSLAIIVFATLVRIVWKSTVQSKSNTI